MCQEGTWAHSGLPWIGHLPWTALWSDPFRTSMRKEAVVLSLGYMDRIPPLLMIEDLSNCSQLQKEVKTYELANRWFPCPTDFYLSFTFSARPLLMQFSLPDKATSQLSLTVNIFRVVIYFIILLLVILVSSYLGNWKNDLGSCKPLVIQSYIWEKEPACNSPFCCGCVYQGQQTNAL